MILNASERNAHIGRLPKLGGYIFLCSTSTVGGGELRQNSFVMYVIVGEESLSGEVGIMFWKVMSTHHHLFRHIFMLR